MLFNLPYGLSVFFNIIMTSLSVNLGPCISNGLFFSKCDGNLNIGKTKSVKIDELKYIFSDNKFHILGLSETWLKPYIFNISLKIPGYNLCRNDRLARRGGGVGLYIIDGLKFKVVFHTGDNDTCEALFVDINIQGSVILVGVVYLSHYH